MSDVEIEFSCGAYLGVILTNLIQSWTCVVVYVTDEGAVHAKRSGDTLGFRQYILSDVTDGALSAHGAKV